MKKTAQNGKGSRRRVAVVDDDDWDLAFKRPKQNTEKNRFKKSGYEKR